MFKLQRLEITGFKSFADYTEVIFTGDGITAVVGPNGCGKSNISDAITWVLGEQKARNLRGGEMQDVIFAGAKVRPPSGMAEVVLHLVRVESGETENANEIDDIDEALSEFDGRETGFAEFDSADDLAIRNPPSEIGNGSNGFHFSAENAETVAVEIGNGDHSKFRAKRKWKPRRAALEFAPGEAVSVTRRLYRSGDSDYLLNGRACRLRDIQDLFAGTGLSGGHYALIQQEKISQILSAKPADRRQLIEEAAGITKFRTRQRAAEVRLDAAKINLRRISDIVSEIDKQANSLRRQAARTRRHAEIGQNMRELQSLVYSAEGRELSTALIIFREKLTAAATTENESGETVKRHAEASQNATSKARQAEDALAARRQTAAANALRRERLASDYAHQTEQAADLWERGKISSGEIEDLKKRLVASSADKERLQVKNQQSGSAGESEISALKAVEESYRQQLAVVRQIEADLEKNRQELFRHTTAAERFREIARQQANALEKLAERAAGLHNEGARAEQTHVERIAELEALTAHIAAESKALDAVRTAQQTALQTTHNARENLSALEKSWFAIRDRANGVRARREALEKLDASNALLAPAVQKLLAAKDKIGVAINGTLADLLQVDAKYEKAVESAFGNFLQTVVVADQADVAAVFEWLKISTAGSVNILIADLPVSELRNRSDNAATVGDLLEISSELRNILSKVLPSAMNLRVIEDVSAAKNFSDENCVTLAGQLVKQNRLFSFGTAQPSEKSGILSFKRELRLLAGQAETLKIEFENAAAAVANAREILSTEEQKVAQMTTKIATSERNLMSAEVNAKSLRQELERAERHKKVISDEKQRLDNEKSELEAKQCKTENERQTADTERQTSNTILAEITSTLTAARASAEAANQILSEHRAAAAAAAERRRSLHNALRRVEQEHAELTSRIESRRTDLSVSTGRLEQLQKSLTALKQQAVSVDNEKETEAETINAAARELTAARTLADKFAGELGKANAAAAAAKDARAALDVGQAEIAVKLQNLTDMCRHELNQPLAALPLVAADFDLPDGKRKIAEWREKLDGFGAVNLLAVDELNEAEERLLFLTSQRKDIVDGIQAAGEALDEIKRRSREKFQSAFDEINRHFTVLFGEIFGGGRGEMSLLDAADVLESGVEIVAQPPGKRLQNLLLLSGGEKALTAIALVLAIFRFRPAPFCLLDEVDAPLDEANVGRFVEKVREMSQEIQFIVITHNKRTMEAARALYGVTMEEAGISKIVSVKFE